MRILLAEDDELLGSGIRAGLAQHGFAVDWVRDGVAAERELATGAYQACVLDLGLPRQDGMDVLQGARARRNTTPMLVLTARDAVPARIAGLDAGADDYLIKPVDLHELAARLRALVRRAHGQSDALLTVGSVTLNPAAHQVMLGGQPVPRIQAAARLAAERRARALARAAGAASVPVGQRDQQQRGGGAHLPPAAQAGRHADRDRARRGLPDRPHQCRCMP